MMSITPLDAWIRKKTQIGFKPAGESFIHALEDYQLRLANETIEYARKHTSFYRKHLSFLPTIPLTNLSDMARLPFTTATDLADNPFNFMAVRQDDVSKIVTLQTSGSTGASKRIFFTDADLELTLDFFHHGMSTLVRPGQRAVVLLPGEKPDSVGNLILRGLQRMNVDALVYGPVADPHHAAESIASFGAHCIVGIPTQVLAVATDRSGAGIGKDRIESLLLTTDYVPKAIAETLKKIWGCRVYTHYGMTEMGFGGGVECDALDGYHLREADLYFEVVDPDTGETCPEGNSGEIVFTTLTRQGMPLIRYRTGDIARMITTPCPCGSHLKRIGYAEGRREGAVRLGSGGVLKISELDELLFGIQGLLDYRAKVSTASDGSFQLHIDVHRSENDWPTHGDVMKALESIGAIRKSLADGNLKTPTVQFSEDGRWMTTGAAKRKILFALEPLV
jgi:phenylacetate-coenzyme A ligase PaaK-like adenylate-forming protein